MFRGLRAFKSSRASFWQKVNPQATRSNTTRSQGGPASPSNTNSAGATPAAPKPPSLTPQELQDAIVRQRLAAGAQLSSGQQRKRVPGLRGGYGAIVYIATLLAGITAIVPLTYWYYEYRQEHMKQKRYQGLKEAQARYSASEGK